MRPGGLAFLSLLTLCAACSTQPAAIAQPGEPQSQARSQASAETGTGSQSGEKVSSREEPERSRRLAPLCERKSPICVAIRQASAALDAGDLDAAQKELEPWLHTDDALGDVVLLLRARLRLESETLAYGAGGEAAREALVLLDSLAARTKQRALSEHVQLQRARALLALSRGAQAMPILEGLASRLSDDAEVQAAFGVACLSVGQVDRSLGPLARAARLEPKRAERHIVLGTARMLVGEYAHAEKSFRAAIALEPSSPRAYGDLGTLLLLQGNVSGGRQYLQRASLLAPEKATYLANLSYAELLDKRPQAALEQAQKALDIDPQLASAWLNLGLAQVALEDRAAARKSFEQASSLDPTDPRPKNNLADLDELEREERSE